MKQIYKDEMIEAYETKSGNTIVIERNAYNNSRIPHYTVRIKGIKKPLATRATYEKAIELLNQN